MTNRVYGGKLPTVSNLDPTALYETRRSQNPRIGGGFPPFGMSRVSRHRQGVARAFSRCREAFELKEFGNDRWEAYNSFCR